MPKSLHRDYPLLSDLTADLRLMGFPAILNPYAHETSSSRANMFSSHVAQAMIIGGAEFPQLFTGVEYELGKYEFNNSHRDQDGEVLAVIPKYGTSVGVDGHGRQNPMFLVIYRGLEDDRLHYFTIDRYTKGTDGFGYENTWMNISRILTQAGVSANTLLPKDMQLVTSPIHKGNKYCLGTNLRVAYMTMTDTIDDAMLISESAAAKFETTEVGTALVNIRQGSRPVNLYGRHPDDVKFMPDIGEKVGPHGYLCAFRPMETETFAADLAPDMLMRPMPHIDDITLVKPGATIIDIDFNINPSQKKFGTFATQMDRYLQATRVFWENVLEVYQKYRQQYPRLSPAFQTLITRAATYMLMFNPGKRKFDIEGMIRKQPVDFIQAVVTYALPRSLNKAFKITDRHGGGI